jgi:hypothetical protein
MWVSTSTHWCPKTMNWKLVITPAVIANWFSLFTKYVNYFCHSIISSCSIFQWQLQQKPHFILLLWLWSQPQKIRFYVVCVWISPNFKVSILFCWIGVFPWTMWHLYLLPNFIDRNDEINPSVIPKTRCIIAEPTRIFSKLLVLVGIKRGSTLLKT